MREGGPPIQTITGCFGLSIEANGRSERISKQQCLFAYAAVPYKGGDEPLNHSLHVAGSCATGVLGRGHMQIVG